MSLGIVPEQGATGVYRDSRFRLTFDDYPDPDSLPFGSVTLTSGAALFDAKVRVRLLDRAIEVDPRSRLAPNNVYFLAVRGVTSLGGRSVPDSGLGFRIGVGTELSPPEPAASVPSWAQVQAQLSPCAQGGCHARTDDAPARDLALDGDPRDSVYGLLGVKALSRRDTASPMVRVAPGDAARSVLLRKLIGGDPSEQRGADRYPKMAIDGERMPPWPAPPLSEQSIRLVEDWIDGGASVE